MEFKKKINLCQDGIFSCVIFVRLDIARIYNYNLKFSFLIENVTFMLPVHEI